MCSEFRSTIDYSNQLNWNFWNIDVWRTSIFHQKNKILKRTLYFNRSLFPEMQAQMHLKCRKQNNQTHTNWYRLEKYQSAWLIFFSCSDGMAGSFLLTFFVFICLWHIHRIKKYYKILPCIANCKQFHLFI